MPVYLELFHGRRHPDEELDDWGFEGPVLGPFPFVHITYGYDIKVGDKPVISSPYCNSDLCVENGLVVFAGSYYGDMSTFSSSILLRRRIKVTQEVFRTDPVLLIGRSEEWVKTYIEWRFKNDVKRNHPILSNVSHSGESALAHGRSHSRSGRSRR